jgi:elongation factor 1-alpha
MINKISPFEKEEDDGFIEYKLKLFPKPDEIRLEKLVSQMNFRLNEGEGEAIYELGIADSGEIIGLNKEEFDSSSETLHEIAELSSADISLIRKYEVTDNHWIAEFLVRKRPIERKSLPPVITIATIGNVDSGKSTLIGTLISGQLDDGDGKNAVLVARYRHEIESGRTSSISTRILGYDSKGEIVNYKKPARNIIEIAKESSKLIRFIDLAGHEKYLKTTIYGLSGYEPDFALVMIDGNRGIQKMSKEHIGLAVLALKIPVIVLLTKIDLAPPHVYKKTMKDLMTLLKSPGLNCIPADVKDKDDVIVLSKKMSSGRLVPIFRVSSVRGDGLELLRYFLNLLPTGKIARWNQERDQFTLHSSNDPFLLFIDEVFSVSGVGKVVSGIIQSGKVQTGLEVYLGPSNGEYEQVRIRSIQTSRIIVNEALPGDYISTALAFKGKQPKITKGMVLTTYKPTPNVTRFEAEVFVLHHPTTMRVNYNTQIHLKTIRSQAKIIKIYNDRDNLRSGDRARVIFEFIYAPQFIMPGMKFVLKKFFN